MERQWGKWSYVLEKVNKVMSSEWHTKLSEGWGNDPQRSFELSLVGQKRHGGLSLKASSPRSGLIFWLRMSKTAISPNFDLNQLCTGCSPNMHPKKGEREREREDNWMVWQKQLISLVVSLIAFPLVCPSFIHPIPIPIPLLVVRPSLFPIINPSDDFPANPH